MSNYINRIAKDMCIRLDIAHRNCQEVNHGLHTVRLLLSLRVHGPVRVTELASMLDITQQAVGKKLRGLSVKGMIISNVDDSDKRARLIDLSAKGIVEVDRMLVVWS